MTTSTLLEKPESQTLTETLKLDDCELFAIAGKSGHIHTRLRLCYVQKHAASVIEALADADPADRPSLKEVVELLGGEKVTLAQRLILKDYFA